MIIAYHFFSVLWCNARILFKIASRVTPTSANTAQTIPVIPNEPSARKATFTMAEREIF